MRSCGAKSLYFLVYRNTPFLLLPTVVYSCIAQYIEKKQEKEKIKRSDRYNVDYKLSDAMNIVYFWMKDEQVFICMKNLLSLNKKKEYLDEFYYKGVNVKHKEGEGIKKINLVSDYIPVCIDTMGMKASECLLISRSYFTENMHEKFMTWAW